MSPAKTSVTFIYKNDASAGGLPAIVHYKPSFEKAPTPRPVVLCPIDQETNVSQKVIIAHGGGYTVCGTFMIPKNQIETLLDMGFVVVAPEYRLCPQVSVIEGPVTDMRECLRWVKTSLPAIMKEQTKVAINPGRVAVMGHSAGGNLAMILGAEPNPPNAVLDIYGAISPEKPFHHEPLKAFAALPDVHQAFLDKVYQGPVPYTSPPMIKDGKPDMSTPRNAWMCSKLKHGTHVKEVVKDDNYAAIDGVAHLKRGFPPTCIIHGTKDVFVPYEYSTEAIEEMKKMGIENELITVPGQDHMFDIMISTEDPLFEYIHRGLSFLKKHV